MLKRKTKKRTNVTPILNKAKINNNFKDAII